MEGWNIRELRTALGKASPLAHETTQMSDAELMKALGHPGQHPEGRFLPETYAYTTGDSDLDVLKRAYAAMEKALASAWARRSDSSVLRTPDEMLTLASIVEKETGIASERPQIAGLFERSLRAGMRLETDPTVIYGMGSNYSVNIRKADLRTDTPYNTYTRAGLPPTPIAMPGVGALEAVANPAHQLNLHFHLHGLIPGGAISEDGEEWMPCKNHYLFNEEVLGLVFRTKFIDYMTEAYQRAAL